MLLKKLLTDTDGMDDRHPMITIAHLELMAQVSKQRVMKVCLPHASSGVLHSFYELPPSS